MECTQRLDFDSSQSERICPEQIGFLGILGTKYPVKHGPNKIGRDPQTCNIVLNLNSISRQHAVINILNGSEYMLMDLDSANKTKLNNKTIQAYLPVPLSDGDTVQFGEVFGVFRLLEDETCLPATQALPPTQMLEEPETPRPPPRPLPRAIVPESPDVSDRDDSFITPSQPKTLHSFKSPSSKYIKSSSKTLSLGTNKIDNIFWSSSKKSNSFNLDDSGDSLNESRVNSDIHEMETQAPYPRHDESTDSIYTAETQVPPGEPSPSIHSLDTQMPVPEHLPAVRRISNQQEVELDLFAANKENDDSIYNAETQMLPAEKDNVFVNSKDTTDDNIFNATTQLPYEKPNESLNRNNNNIFTADTQFPTEKENTCMNRNDPIFCADTQPPTDNKEFNVSIELKSNTCKEISKDRINKSDDIIMFEDIDTQPFFDDLQSQPIVPPEMLEEDIPLSQNDTIDDDGHMRIKPEPQKSAKSPKSVKRKTRLKSDSSTDCEDIDIQPTQVIPIKQVNDDELTDCEDELVEIHLNKSDKKNMDPINNKVNFEDLATQVIPDVVDSDTHSELNQKTEAKGSCFEDMLTQVIPEVNTGDKDPAFEDLPTQVLEEDIVDKPATAEEYSEEIVTTFKIPFQTPIKIKRKDTKPDDSTFLKPFADSGTKGNINKADSEKYYAATQELFEDLSSQTELLKPNVNLMNNNLSNKKPAEQSVEDKVVLSSVEDDKVGKGLPHLDAELSPKKNFIVDRSPGSSDADEKINKFITSLSAKQIGDVIGVQVASMRRAASDPSDPEVTPKKLRPFKFMETELPDSQEIKTSVTLSSKIVVTESSSESERENDTNDSQENTPILFKKKKRAPKISVRKDLTNTFDVDSLPSRIITRLRKPTSKMQENDTNSKKRSKNLLTPKYLTEQDDDVDSEIIHENITRLKSKNEKKNNKDTSTSTESSKRQKTDKIKIESVKRISSEVDSDLTIQKTESRRNVRAKNCKDVTIDLTTDEDKCVKKPDIKTVDNSKQRDRRKKDKDNVGDNNKIEAMSKIKEPEVSNQKTRETRKNDRAKKKEQEKITNYTISVDKDANNSSSTSKVDHSLNSTGGSSRSTRTTRSKNKDKDDERSVKKALSPEPDTGKRKRGRPRRDEKGADREKDNGKVKKVDSKEKKEESRVEPGQEVRRSRRQKTIKEKSDSQETSRRHEQSTVYNVSSESGNSSPLSLKRVAAEDAGVPSPKRSRAGVTSCSSPPAPAPSRGLPTCRVLFTAFPYEHLKGDLEKLGAAVVSDVSSCSVLATLQLRRTFKLLCAVGLGRPVVGATWLQECLRRGELLDPWQYLLKDAASEARFGFTLERTLRGPRGYLRGHCVAATPRVLPSAPEMKMIVECSGGRWLPGTTGPVEGEGKGEGAGGGRWLVVSVGGDRALWAGLRARGATVVSSELILSGVLTQTLDIDKHLLI